MKNIEIEGSFLSEKQRWGDTILATCSGDGHGIFTVKTKAEIDELVPGLNYRWYGHWVEHYKYGRQFQASTFIQVLPHDENGTIAYLIRAPGVGRITAKKLWDRYHGNAVKQLRENPAQVVVDLEMKKFTPEVALAAASYLEAEHELEDATIDLMSLLAGKGFPKKTLKHALRRWGNKASAVVRRNPFLLMTIPGCGFLRADELYLELGHRPAALKRQTLCLWHSIYSDTDGHTWFPPQHLEEALVEKLSSADARAVLAAKLGLRSGLLAIYRDEAGGRWLTESSRSQVEQDVADLVAAKLALPPTWPSLESIPEDISPHQFTKLAQALQGRIAIFGGSPGTGKTYTAARLIKLILKSGQSVAVVAPTGKAAVRITEALQATGIPIKARTIHSYLGVSRLDEDSAWSFTHNESNPVEEKYIVVDESSMIDVSLMAAFLRAQTLDTHVLFVGDVQQLPPVGHGAPLRDLISAGCPYGELKEIRRNAGEIVQVCAKIRDEEKFAFPRHLDIDMGINLVFQDAGGQDSLERILRDIKAVRDGGLADPVWETQVICAVNEKSPLSRVELNTVLQAELNGMNRSKTKFWVGDKIVCLKNSFLPAVEDALDEFDAEGEEGLIRENEESGQPELYVANGEIGRVLEEFPNKTIAEFFNPKRVVLIPRGEGAEQPKIDLAYAISCHKSQGSEWPVVIVAIDEYYGARMVCDRSWIYTAISRAKKACLLVGLEETARGMIQRKKIVQRKTFLVERLTEARKKYEKKEERPVGSDTSPVCHSR